ncbi:conjugal transfer protein TraG N-terminal domain-containing protein [Cupriavidus sp. TMH.W2]|uniref:conjugal transfer protein TraG N-terminal domain-containing protein n=1 Tax=Cupriavidus sp. TMH.W2 TaxID=3434465 RepID=UPI003D77DCB0
MFDFNIYVLGDASSFYTALNAVAMVFNQKGFLDSAFMVGGLVMLISGILFMIGKQSDGAVPGVMGPVSGMFGLFAVVWTATIPTSVVVNDIYTGNVVKVDNVPLILSLPASAFTTASNRIFQLTNTAFQSVNGSYMGVSSQGFVTPLKLLFSLRQGFENADVNLATSVKAFILDCTPNSSTFSMDDLKQSANSLNYILTHARDNGITTYWSSAFPQGTSLSCNESAALISQDANVKFLSGANKNFNNMLNQNMKDKNPNGGSYSQTDVENVWQNVIPGTWKSATDSLGLAQGARDFMMNALTFNTVANTFNCMSSNSDQASFNLCNVQMTQAFEQSRTDAAAAGSFFSKMMMPAMIFMQLMFFSFAPLVIIYGVMKGGGALGMYVKYLLFGIWTSSWLPFSAVIQMYIQNDVADKLSQIQSGMLTVGNFSPVYYDVLASRLSVASDMLAATPLVSLAMLTGSAMAVTSLAGRWSGRDHVDEKQASPDIMRNGAITDVGASAQFGPAITGNMLTGIQRADAALRTHSSGEMLDNNVSSANAQVASTRAEAAQSFEKALSFMKSHSSGWKSSDTDVTAIGKDYTSRATEVREASEQAMDRHGFSQEERSEFRAAITAKGGFSSPFGGVEASAQAAAAATKGRVSSQDFMKSMSVKSGTDQQWADSISNRAQHAMDRYSGEDTKTAQGLSASARESVGRVQSAEQRYQEAVSLKTSTDTSFSARDDSLGAMILANPAAQFAIEQRHNQLANNQDYQTRLDAERTRLQRAGNIRGSEEVARFNALEGMRDFRTTAAVMSSLSGISGPSKFDASANKNVAPAANAVAANPADTPLSLKSPHVLNKSAPAPELPSGNGTEQGMGTPVSLASTGGTGAQPPVTRTPASLTSTGGTGGQSPVTGTRVSAPAAHASPAIQAQPHRDQAAPSGVAAANSAGGSPGDMNNLHARVGRLASNSIPDFDGAREATAAKTAGAPQAISDQKQAIEDSSPVISPEQVRNTFHREVDTVANSFKGAGMAWNDFEKAHPYMAAGIEAAVTMMPVGRAIGGAAKLYKLSGAARKGWEGVQAAKAGVTTAGKEMARLESAFTSPNGALLGGKKALDANRVANLGFKSTEEFVEAYGKAGANVIKAEKELATKAGAYAKDFGASMGKDGLPKDATLGFIAQNASRQAVAVGKTSGGAGLLELSKYEANIHRQEMIHNQEVQELRRGVRGR